MNFISKMSFLGSFLNDPHCVEKPAAVHDQCCVLVICSDAVEERDEFFSDVQGEDHNRVHERSTEPGKKVIDPPGRIGITFKQTSYC